MINGSEWHVIKSKRRRCLSALLALGVLIPGSSASATVRCSETELAWHWSEDALEPAAAALTPDSQLLIVGASRDQPGVHNENSGVPHDAVIRAVDWSSGDIVWSTAIDGEVAREVDAIATTPNGDTVVAGQVGITPTAIGGYEEEFGWIARLNSEGELLWERRLGENGMLHGLHSIVPFADDSVLVAGWTGVSSHESDDGTGWLARLTADGQMAWGAKPVAKVVGVLPADRETAVIVLIEDKSNTVEAHRANAQGSLVPVWEHILDTENIWMLPISRGIGENVNLSTLESSGPADGDTISILSMTEQGVVSWETSLELAWPWIVAPVGPNRELLVVPDKAVDALALVILDANSGERITWLDPGLGVWTPRDVVGVKGGFDFALIGVDPEDDTGTVARVNLICD